MLAKEMHLQQVNDWLATLASGPTPPMTCGLSPQGFEAVWRIALQTLTPEAMQHAAHIQGLPFSSACIVAAATVCTAPLEWIAVLLARGTSVTLKHGTEVPGLSSTLVDSAQAFGLPLSSTSDRKAAHRADLPRLPRPAHRGARVPPAPVPPAHPHASSARYRILL